MNACLDRIEAVLAQPELPDRGRETFPKAGGAPEVEFRNVTFAYGEKEVLHDVSFTLEKNRMLALVGPSGGGKSTVANLLSGFGMSNRDRSWYGAGTSAIFLSLI